MNLQPLISIVTSSFNRAGYLSTAIESVLAQNIDNLEMLVVDDGSEDDTREVVKKFQAGVPLTHYFHQANQRPSVARDREFEAHPEADVVYGDYMVIDGLGGFDPEDRLAEDYGLWLRFSTRYHFHYVPKLLGYHRVMDNQILSDKARRLDANEALLHQFLERFSDVLAPAQNAGE